MTIRNYHMALVGGAPGGRGDKKGVKNRGIAREYKAMKRLEAAKRNEHYALKVKGHCSCGQCV